MTKEQTDNGRALFISKLKSLGEHTRLMDFLITIALLITALVLMSPFIASDYIVGHDTHYHVSLINAIYDTWGNGNIGDRIVSLIAQDYGYGSGIFYSLVPATLAVLFMKMFSISASTAIALELVLVYWLGAVVVYFFSKSIFKKRSLAIITALVYQFFPYLMGDIYERFALSETFLIVAVPLIFYGLYSLIHENRPIKFFVLFTLGYVLAMFMHFTMSVYITIYAVIYLCFYIKKIFKERQYIYIILSCVTILIITSVYYVPMLINYGDTLASRLSRTSGYLSYTGTWAFTSFWLVGNTVSNFAVIGSYIYYLVKNKGQNSRANICLFTLLVVSFAMSTVIFPWVIFPDFVGNLQFAMRLFLVNALFLAVAFTYLLTVCKSTICKAIMTIVVSLMSVMMFVYGSVVWHAPNEYWKVMIKKETVNSTISGHSYETGLGGGKNGDYLPTNATQEYLFTRANEALVIDSNVEIKELANYQSINQLSFIVTPKSDGYVVLNLPYSIFADCKVYQMTTGWENYSLEGARLSAQEIGGEEYLRIDFVDSESECKFTISYTEDSALNQYLIENPFEFIALSGEFVAHNFVRENSQLYTVDFDIITETTIELPTLYYKGYTLTYTTASGENINLTAEHGRNGFIEITLSESGTLRVEFTAEYIDICEIISLVGVVIYLGTIIVLILLKRKGRDSLTPEGNQDELVNLSASQSESSKDKRVISSDMAPQ